jgi:hypothetical protein
LVETAATVGLRAEAWMQEVRAARTEKPPEEEAAWAQL